MLTRFRVFLPLVALIALLMVSLPTQAQSSQTDAHKAAAVKFLDTFADPTKFAQVDALVAPDFVVHLESGDMNWAAMQGGAASVAAAMPDVRYTPLIVVAQDNYVGLRYEFSGTFTNPMTNFDGSVLQPTGKPVVIYSNAILTFNEAGLISEYEEVFDNLSFMAQLGAFPMPETAMTPPAPELDASTWTIKPMSADFTATLVESLKAANQAAYNEGNVDALDAAYAPDYISYPGQTDLATGKAQIAAIRAAIPDFVSTTDLVIAEGNWVVYRWTASGTFSGLLDLGTMQIPPTNQPVQYGGIVLSVANDDGLVTADWNEVDNLSFGMQFGLIPAQGQ